MDELKEFRRRIARAAHTGILPIAVPANWAEKDIASRAWNIADKVIEWEGGDPNVVGRKGGPVPRESNDHRRESMMTALTGLLPMAIAQAWADEDLAARSWKGADLIIDWEDGDPEARKISVPQRRL